MVFPSYFAALSALILLVEIAWRSSYGRRLRERVRPSKSQDPKASATAEPRSSTDRSGLLSDLRDTIKSHGLWIFVLRCVRLASCLALVVISGIAFVFREEAEASGGFSVFKFKGGKKQRKHDRARDALQRAEWIELIQVAFYVRYRLYSKLGMHPSDIFNYA